METKLNWSLHTCTYESISTLDVETARLASLVCGMCVDIGSCLSLDQSNGGACQEIPTSLLSLQIRGQWRRCSPQNSQHCRRVLLAGQHASRHWVFRHTILVWPRRTDCRGSHSCGHRICLLDHRYLDLGGDSEGTGIIYHTEELSCMYRPIQG